MTPDVNLLVAASHSDHPHYAASRAWLAQALGMAAVGASGILASHWTSSEERMRAHPVVLCLQDTTELDFNGQGIAGLGSLSYEPQRGMYVHPTYAVTPDREPLGVLDAASTGASV